MRQLALLAVASWIAPLVIADSPTAGPRLKLSLDPDWRFVRQDVPEAKNALFDDSKWSVISCPHTFNDIDTFDDFSPGNHIGELNQWTGRVWYRKHFTPDASWA